MSTLKLSSDTLGGSVTLAAPTTASNVTVTLPNTSGTTALLADLTSGLATKADVLNPVPSYANTAAIPAAYTGVARVGADLYVGDGVNLSKEVSSVYLSESNTASKNVTLIQAALNVGGDVYVTGVPNSVNFINASLLIGDNTHLKIATGLEIKAVSSPAIGPLLIAKPLMAARSAVTITWTTGLLATVNWTGHNLTTSDSVWITGATQYQYCGVFIIRSITNANSFVVQLRRLPTTAATGTITALKAGKNITLEGGIWNRNLSGGNYTDGYLQHTIWLGGISGLRIIGEIIGKDMQKFLFNIGAVQGFIFDGAMTSTLTSDGLHLYGPAFDCNISNLSGVFGDDTLILQTLEIGEFASYNWTYGDILNVTATNISGCITGLTKTVAIYNPSESGYIDGITLNNCACYNGTPLVDFDTWAGIVGNFGTITLNNPQVYSGVAGANMVVLNYAAVSAMNIKSLVINNPMMQGINYSGHLVHINGPQACNANITINQGYANMIDSVINSSGTGIVRLNLHDFTVGTSYTFFRVYGGTTYITARNLTHEVNADIWLDVGNAGSAVYVDVDKISSPTDSQTVNKGAGAFMYSMNKGWKVDASLLTKLDGAIVYNTNGTLGTLGHAGVVQCQYDSVSASLQWVRPLGINAGVPTFGKY